MARNSQSGGRRGGEQRSNPALIPGLIALVLIAVAVAVAVKSKKPAAEIDAAPPKQKPFADMPPEVPPPAREHKPGSNLPMAPENVASEPKWLSAQALAVEAKALYDATVAAKAKGDQTLANEKGAAARRKYDAAINETAEWEEELLSKYNEYDGKIKAIKDARTDWFNKLRWLEKSVAH